MEIGQGIEDGIVSGLTDAVMGTKTLAEAATGVLNNLKRKLVEVAIQQAVSGIGNFLGTALGSIFAGGLSKGPKPFKPAAGTFGTNIPSGSLLKAGSFGISTIKRENGGPVMAGGSYLVGEKGPEMFTPSRSGTIIPNNAMGGVTNNIVINVDASGTAVAVNDSESNQFGEQLAAAIQAEIINQKRSGGLLA